MIGISPDQVKLLYRIVGISSSYAGYHQKPFPLIRDSPYSWLSGNKGASTMWSSAALNVLEQFHQRMDEEARRVREIGLTEFFRRRDEFLLPVGSEVGHLLHALIVARKAKRIVELGTSYGYSTLFLAEAARQTGGKVLTFEIADDKQASARKSIGQAGLGDHVEWNLGDAVTLLEETPGPFDFVLVDLWKELYVPCFERFYPKLADHALVASDNMLEPAVFREDAEAFQTMVRSKPDIQSMLLPLGSGLELSCVYRQSQTEDQQ